MGFFTNVYNGILGAAEHILRRGQGILSAEGTAFHDAVDHFGILRQHHGAGVDVGLVGHHLDGFAAGTFGGGAGYLGHLGVGQQHAYKQEYGGE